MSIAEMAVLLAEIQVGDNRTVDELTIAYWHNTIGDLSLQDAQAAVRRFRRERPGVYLEMGHILELAGVSDERVPPEHVRFDREFERHEVRLALQVLGFSERDYDLDRHVRVRVAEYREQLAIEGTAE